MSITVTNLSKRFRTAHGEFKALDDVSIDIPDGELVALLGPSGSGKTTLLRIIAGLEVPDSGTIALRGKDATHRSPQQRRVGFVFQHYALFRHMTVLENIAFGLTVKPKAERPSNAEIEAKSQHLLKMVQLENYAERRPHQLSGGQRQRIALARALAVEPQVLLLDEPFGALDAQVRRELRRWLRKLHDEVGITSVFVTHDQEEALEVADRVAVFHQGRIAQVGTPDEVYHHPANPTVHRFLGHVNVLRIDGQERWIRPEDLHLSTAADADHPLRGRIDSVLTAAPAVRVELTLDDGTQAEAMLSHSAWQALGLRPGAGVAARPSIR